MEDGLDQDPEHARFVRWFLAFEDATRSARVKADRDRDYYDGKQWTASEVAELNRRRQPVITVNRIKRKVDFLTGSETLNRADPKAYPRNPSDEAAARAATDAIRFVCQHNDFDAIRSNVWENMVVEGVGAALVGARVKGGQTEITIEHVPWQRLFWDPHSAARDFADAKYKGVAIWMDLEDALARWPGAGHVLEATLDRPHGPAEAGADRPANTAFADPARRRVRIVEIWFRDRGRWLTCRFTGAGRVTETGPSPWLDEDRAGECPLILVSAHVDRENNRYGAVREMISPQDEINKRRSKALHLLNMRQVITEKGATEGMGGVRKAQGELARPDGVVEVAPGMRFEILPTGDMTAGNLSLLQEAKDEIDGMGPNASLQGKQKQELSGRALRLQQQAGMAELGRLVDARRHWDLAVYRAVWHRIRQFWTAERWVRVTDTEGNLKFVGLNRPVRALETSAGEFEALAASIPGLPEGEREQAFGMLVETAGLPGFQRVVGTENSVAALDIDIILDQGPDTITVQQEQFDQLVKLPQAGVPIPADVIIEASSLPNKRRILDRLRAAAEDQP